jgi:nitrite reductase/ring-hydroxylating ferredoxin subunit/Fe-S cluster biogenesis protein NfuA
MSEAQEQYLNAEGMVEQLNALVEQIESYPDAKIREKTLDLVQIILALHREALRRVLTSFDSLPEREQILSRIAGDDVARTILLIHGLLPTDLQTRVAVALDELRPQLLLQGCDVELLTVENGNARMRLMRNGRGAPPISDLKLEIEKALIEAAPELLGIEIEGVSEQIEATAKAAAILGSMLPKGNGASQPAKLVQIKREKPIEKHDGKWISVIRSLTFEEGEFKIINYADIDLLICKTGGDFYAFRNSCALENRPLDDATFENPMLVCACHGYHYNLRRKGVCAEKPDLRLESLPLKIEDDKVKVGLS